MAEKYRIEHEKSVYVKNNNMFALVCFAGLMYFTRTRVLYGNALKWNGCARHRGQYVIAQNIECN